MSGSVFDGKDEELFSGRIVRICVGVISAETCEKERLYSGVVSQVLGVVSAHGCDGVLRIFLKLVEVFVELSPVFGGASAEVVSVGGEEDDRLVERLPHLTHGSREGADESVDAFDDVVVGIEFDVSRDSQRRQSVGVILVTTESRRAAIVDFDGVELVDFGIIGFVAFEAHQDNLLAEVRQEGGQVGSRSCVEIGISERQRVFVVCLIYHASAGFVAGISVQIIKISFAQVLNSFSDAGNSELFIRAFECRFFCFGEFVADISQSF
jgi:hypothetical protein